jgi:tRNA A-37 threonylcarbamoyl transferase component Bud32
MTQVATQPDALFGIVAGKLSVDDPGLAQRTPTRVQDAGRDFVDYLYAGPDDPHTPKEIFPRLRWGGQFVFYTQKRAQAEAMMEAFAGHGFDVPGGLSHVTHWRWWFPLFNKQTWWFVARKVQLVQPGEFTERFTYNVHLVRGGDVGSEGGDGYIVAKEVPTFEMVRDRLRNKWPDIAQEIIDKRARKFTEKIFPLFLTREAAILKIVQRDLPEPYRNRIPRVIDIDKDDRGYVRKMTMTWLRNGGKPLSQVEFARQSAQLLQVLHDTVGVMHLDLRLDNFVITENGVGFVDFGSSVRDDEDLKENPLLNGLFDELMRTSEIQRMLGAMSVRGLVTSNAITCGLHKVDKAVDFFYLAVQISEPHTNPDLKGLVQFDPISREAQALATLTDAILRPENPANPQYRSAADILRGIERIARQAGTRQSGGLQ